MGINQASPAIAINEIDLTNVVTGVQSSTGAFVGQFNWGPVDDPRLIDNEKTLAATYGVPTDDGKTIGPSVDFLTCTQFLNYSANLWVNRAVKTGAKNAMATGAGAALLKNNNAYLAAVFSAAGGGAIDSGPFVAKYAGTLGNSLSVSVFNPGAAAGFDALLWKYAPLFPSRPATSPWLQNLCDSDNATNYKNDEVHVVVIDEQGKFTGVRGSVLETFAYVSVVKGAKTVDGGSNYLPDVLNTGSAYINFGYNSTSASGKAFGSNAFSSVTIPGSADYAAGTWTALNSIYPLTQGADSPALDAAAYELGFDVFEDVDTITLDLLIAPGMALASEQVTVITALNTIAATLRRDCVVVSSPSRDCVVSGYGTIADAVTPTLAFANLAGLPASSYLILDNNYVKVLDKYNDRYIWIPAASTTAGIMAATDLAEGPWYSPAGQKRGQYFGIVDIAYNPTKTQRDQLYAVGINPIVNLPGRGTTLYGDKTREMRPSAFNRINVRRLFLNLERAISIAARGVMFEFNDEFTRAEFVNIVEPYLREIKGRRGITEFVVQCDASNNTPAVVDRNELIASVFVKPSRSINYVTLNFVAVRTGVAFEEVIGTV